LSVNPERHIRQVQRVNDISECAHAAKTPDEFCARKHVTFVDDWRHLITQRLIPCVGKADELDPTHGELIPLSFAKYFVSLGSRLVTRRMGRVSYQQAGHQGNGK